MTSDRDRFDDSDQSDLVPSTPKTAGDGEPSASAELQKAFWTAVLLFNVGLLGVSLGLMLVGFERRWLVGSVILLVGSAAFGRGILIYHRVRKD